MNISLADPTKQISMTLVNASTIDVGVAIEETLHTWSNQFERYGLNSPKAIGDIQPIAGGAHHFKLALFRPATNPNSSAFVTNLVDGWNSLAHGIAKRLKCPQLQLLSTEVGSPYPRHAFEVWRAGESRRIVMAIRDSDKWRFFEKGDIESFEHVDHYKAKRIKDRLTRQLLLEYADALGWKLDHTFLSPSIQSEIYEII